MLEQHFTRYYETTTSGISLMSTFLLLGYLIGGTSSGIIIPTFGIKKPTILAGLSCMLGCVLIAATLGTKNLREKILTEIFLL